MLTMVEVFNGTGESLALPMQDLSSGYVIQDIQGLDPVKAEIVSTKQAQLDGSYRQASSRGNRNILMNLGFIPEYAVTTVQALRRSLYAYLIPKTLVTLRFHIDGAGFVDILGEVESCEAPLFTQEPQATVSILCFDPDFSALASAVFNGSTTNGADVSVFEYPGSSPAGFVFVLPVTRNIAGFTLYNTLPNNQQQAFDFVDPLVTGDVVTLTTIPGNKSIIRTRAGVDKSILYGVNPNAIWPFFAPGDNTVRVSVAGTPTMPYSITYTAKYGGL
jgi:hypothetical protein